MEFLQENTELIQKINRILESSQKTDSSANMNAKLNDYLRKALNCMRAMCDGQEFSSVPQANDNIPLVRCFKTYGENIIKELGFELDHKYDHDQFHTNRYRKGLLMVEFTYEDKKLQTVDLTIDETFCKPITYAELQALSPILGEVPE